MATLRIDDILEEVKKNDPGADLSVIRRAYVLSARAHRGQRRVSGEPYLMHPLAVAHLLAKMRMDVDTIAAGLLHDTVEDDTDTSLEQIEELFGKGVAGLVDGVTKIGQMSFKSREHRQAENFKKILIATSKDIRVILVKLADRLHNMRTLEHMAPEKIRVIAEETLEIYAPLASRLGIQWAKNELEDLAMRYLHPHEHYKLIVELAAGRKDRERFIEEVVQILRDLLESNGIHADVRGRVKNVYSVWKKMQTQGITLDHVHDLVAFRILVANVAECYAVLGLIHAHWKPVPGRIKDYIALPKPNGYQSLHTTVMGPFHRRMEVQIRTEEMHRLAEDGVAAHWRYKEGHADGIATDAEWYHWLRKLVEQYQQEESPDEYLKSVKTDLFPDEVYVFTPKGEVLSFPRGATPIDFAYRIHTEVGHTCVGARVNDKVVPISYQLANGDRIEIQTRKDRGPSRDWLRFVKTASARSKIREYVRRQEKDRSIELGRSIADRELRKHKMTLARVEKQGRLDEVAAGLGFKETPKLLASLGNGRVSPAQFIKAFEVPEDGETHDGVLERLMRPLKAHKGRDGIKIQGVDDVLFSLAKCCNPLPGENVRGFITRGRGIKIHAADCLELDGVDPERIVDVEWDTGPGVGAVGTKVDVYSRDEPLVLSNVSKVIGSHGVNISEVKSANIEGNAVIHFELQVEQLGQLEAIMKDIANVRGVTRVERVRSGARA